MGFARFSRKFPQLATAALLSAVALGSFAGCRGENEDSPEGLSPVSNDPVVLRSFGRQVGMAGNDDGDTVVSRDGSVTCVVDRANNMVNVFDTSGTLKPPPMITSIDLATLRLLTTDADPFLANLDEDGEVAGDDSYDNPGGSDAVTIGGVAIHPSNEFIAVAVNDADDNTDPANPNDDIITRCVSRLVWVSLVSVAQGSDGLAILPARAAGDVIAVTRLSDTDENGNAADGDDVSFFNVTGVQFSPDGNNMCVIGDYSDAIDMDDGSGSGDPDGDTDDGDDIGDDTGANEYQVDETTICFLGQDGFGNGPDPIPDTAEDIRDITFNGDGGGDDLSVANFGYSLDDDHDFDSLSGAGIIAVLGESLGNNDSGDNAHLDVVLEDARDGADNHDADSDTGVSVTGVDSDGLGNEEGEVASVNNARGLDSTGIPAPTEFVAGTGVIRDVPLIDVNSDGNEDLPEDVFVPGGEPDTENTDDSGLPTDVLYGFVAQIFPDQGGDGTAIDAVFVTGFGLRGDLQARYAPGSATFGTATFVSNDSDKVLIAASLPGRDSVMVNAINTVTGANNYLYGELLDGSEVSLGTYVAASSLTLSDIEGFSRQGRLFLAFSNSAGDDSNSIGVMELSSSIQTVTNGNFGFDIINPSSIAVVSGSVYLGGSGSTDAPGAASIATGERDFAAVYNNDEETVTFIGY